MVVFIAQLQHLFQLQKPKPSGIRMARGNPLSTIASNEANSEVWIHTIHWCISHDGFPWDEDVYLHVSKNGGKTPKMDGESNGKPYFLNGWFGGNTHYFRKKPFSYMKTHEKSTTVFT